MYQNWHRRRLDTLPGVTGLWQVSGRNSLSFDEMVSLDIEYIEHWSFERDLKILVRTPIAVLRGGV
jgi:lipopolysaccharide/colanic/teichoic acid biosynthesis glycosyltransferase